MGYVAPWPIWRYRFGHRRSATKFNNYSVFRKRQNKRTKRIMFPIDAKTMRELEEGFYANIMTPDVIRSLSIYVMRRPGRLLTAKLMIHIVEGMEHK